MIYLPEENMAWHFWPFPLKQLLLCKYRETATGLVFFKCILKKHGDLFFCSCQFTDQKKRKKKSEIIDLWNPNSQYSKSWEAAPRPGLRGASSLQKDQGRHQPFPNHKACSSASESLVFNNEKSFPPRCEHCSAVCVCGSSQLSPSLCLSAEVWAQQLREEGSACGSQLPLEGSAAIRSIHCSYCLASSSLLHQEQKPCSDAIFIASFLIKQRWNTDSYIMSRNPWYYFESVHSEENESYHNGKLWWSTPTGLCHIQRWEWLSCFFFKLTPSFTPSSISGYRIRDAAATNGILTCKIVWWCLSFWNRRIKTWPRFTRHEFQVESSFSESECLDISTQALLSPHHRLSLVGGSKRPALLY